MPHRLYKFLSPTLACGLLLTGLPGLARGQVGYPPQDSPFRDIRHSTYLSFAAGYFGGSGGQIGVGAHHGTMYTLRYDFLADGTFQIGLAGSVGNLDRLIVDANDPVATRVKGPVSQRLILSELALQFNVTGGKTWHNLAPFVGLGAGIAFGQKTPADTSGYTYGTKFFFAPKLGTRFFLSRNLYLNLEARGYFVSLTYPSTYQQEPSKDPGTTDKPHAVLAGKPLKEYAPSPWISIGVGYKFKFPLF